MSITAVVLNEGKLFDIERSIQTEGGIPSELTLVHMQEVYEPCRDADIIHDRPRQCRGEKMLREVQQCGWRTSEFSTHCVLLSESGVASDSHPDGQHSRSTETLHDCFR